VRVAIHQPIEGKVPLLVPLTEGSAVPLPRFMAESATNGNVANHESFTEHP
jgi:hypothetical protein